MKLFTTILLATLILALATRDVATYVSFKINQEFITNNWCINTDEPEMACCGKCFLSKEIQENNEERSSDSKIPLLEEHQKNYYYTSTNQTGAASYPGFSDHNFHLIDLKTRFVNNQLLDPPDGLI